MARKGKRSVISYQYCTPMQPESTVVQASCFVAVPADRDADPVRNLATFTQDLNTLADWLQHCGVDLYRWNLRAFTGSPCIRSWSLAGLKFTW